MTLGRICRYYFVVVFRIIFFYVKRKHNVLLHTEIQMLFSCCYHYDAFKKFKQTRQPSASLELEPNTKVAPLEIVQKTFCRPFLTRGTKEYPLILQKFCKVGCTTWKFGKVCMHTSIHTQKFWASITLQLESYQCCDILNV